MTETVSQRWYRWDKLANDGKQSEIIAEFDEMLRKNQKITVGDLVRRDNALEEMGIASISANALQKRGYSGRKEIYKLKMELATIIMGYEKELLKCKREEISEFSQGCMERYFNLMKELKEEDKLNGQNVTLGKD